MEAIHIATPFSEIQVYAPFPHAVVLDVNLDIDPANWHWVHCLTFKIETLSELQFSHRPYKWIRYAIGAVTGAQGDLSFNRDSPDGMDYDDDLPQDSVVLYYHTSDEEKRRMFPADPDIGHTIVTSSAATSRRARFHGNVQGRDALRCVLSDIAGVLCDAVHLVPHSKGDAVCYLSLSLSLTVETVAVYIKLHPASQSRTWWEGHFVGHQQCPKWPFSEHVYSHSIGCRCCIRKGV